MLNPDYEHKNDEKRNDFSRNCLIGEQEALAHSGSFCQRNIAFFDLKSTVAY